jgi:hypothetical protein
MRGAAPYIIGFAVVALAIGVAAEVSIRSSACMACHTREANFATWMGGRLKADKKGFSHELIACADCHMLGSPQKTAMSRVRSLLHAVTYLVPQIDPRKTQVTDLFNRTRVPNENCQYCHQASVNRKEMYVKDIPPGLKDIGLIMDHPKHLITSKDTCARCHERYKDKASLEADKSVNYAEVNHLACDSCHTMASHSYRAGQILPMTEREYIEAREAAWNRLSTNPRWMVSIPVEQSCRRCHNGKIHYKAKIFLADCSSDTEFENCLKCHPMMTRQYFEEQIRKRQKTTSASAGEKGWLSDPKENASEFPLDSEQTANRGTDRQARAHSFMNQEH